MNARSSRSLPRVCFRLRLSLSVWAHEPQSCCAASSISCPLLTSIHISSPTHLPPPSLLVRCLRRWFRLGNRQLSRKWEAAPVRRVTPVSVVQGPSRDGGGLRSTPAGGVGEGSMVRGLFAAGFKKRREYVKHPIDRRAPRWPEVRDQKASAHVCHG